MKKPKVIKTIRRKDIPKEVKKRAIKEALLIAEHKTSNYHNDETILGFADWSDTPSGFSFWENIDEAKESL